MHYNDYHLSQNDTKDFILYVSLLIVATTLLILGVEAHADGFILLVLSSSFWIASSFYKGRYDVFISLGFILSALIIFVSMLNNRIDSFIGLIIFIGLFILAFFVRENNRVDLNSEMIIIPQDKMLCIHCNAKIGFSDKFCHNCGNEVV